MNDPSILPRCTSFLNITVRTARLELSGTHGLLLIAIHSVKLADYDHLATATGLSSTTLRNNTSPLRFMEKQGLISSDIVKPEGCKKARRVFSLTEEGKSALCYIVTGKALEGGEA